MCSPMAPTGASGNDAHSEDEKSSRISCLRPFHLNLLKSDHEQHGFLAGISEVLERGTTLQPSVMDPRVFFNVASPSSTFICGSQGSGKSHTLSCMLENCLIKSEANELPRPLTGLVFHYDTFISDFGGSPCEAAYLSSNSSIKVRVLCSPTNFQTVQVGILAASNDEPK
jgi:hypothetical protein